MLPISMELTVIEDIFKFKCINHKEIEQIFQFFEDIKLNIAKELKLLAEKVHDNCDRALYTATGLLVANALHRFKELLRSI